MKVFRVVLSIGTTFIEADYYCEGRESVGFFRGESLIAQFARLSVKEITESPDLGPRKGLFERLREEPPPPSEPPPP